MRNPNKEAAAFERPITLYNAADEPFRAMCNGFSFDLPADGTLDIYDVWGIPSGLKDGKVVAEGPQRVFLYARDAASHITRKHESRGIVELTGNAEIDEKRKADAKKAWTKQKLEQVKREIDGWSNYLRVFHADPANKGNYPNSMPDSTRAAYEWRAAYELGLKGGRKRFSCPHDGYQTDDAQKWEQHQITMHAAEADAAKAEEAPEPKRRGRRSLSEAAEAADVSAARLERRGEA